MLCFENNLILKRLKVCITIFLIFMNYNCVYSFKIKEYNVINNLEQNYSTISIIIKNINSGKFLNENDYKIRIYLHIERNDVVGSITNPAYMYDGNISMNKKYKFHIEPGVYNLMISINYQEKRYIFHHIISVQSINFGDSIIGDLPKLQLKERENVNINFTILDNEKFSLSRTIYDLIFPVPFWNFLWGEFFKYGTEIQYNILSEEGSIESKPTKN